MWLHYYGRHFDPDDLFVLDHDSTDRSAEQLAGRCQVVPVHRAASSDHRWLRNTVESFQRFLFQSARLEQLPILESNYLPLPAEGQTTFGFLKASFERCLRVKMHERADASCGAEARIPGIPFYRRREPLYQHVGREPRGRVLVCFESPGRARVRALQPRRCRGRDTRLSDIRDYVRRRWPYVPNRSLRNQCLLSTEKATKVLGYRPIAGGRYIDPGLGW